MSTDEMWNVIQKLKSQMENEIRGIKLSLDEINEKLSTKADKRMDEPGGHGDWSLPETWEDEEAIELQKARVMKGMASFYRYVQERSLSKMGDNMIPDVMKRGELDQRISVFFGKNQANAVRFIETFLTDRVEFYEYRSRTRYARFVVPKERGEILEQIVGYVIDNFEAHQVDKMIRHG